MSRDTEALLEAYEHLPAEEKRAFTEEVLRRSLPFDSGPLEDEEIGAASAALFESLQADALHHQRARMERRRQFLLLQTFEE
jgi:hypothetical protein